MATTSTPVDQLHHTHPAQAAVLVSLPSLTQDAVRELLAHLAQAFAGMNVTVATPDADSAQLESSSLRVVGYTPTVPSPGSWSLTAADFLNAHELAQQHHAGAVLLLGPEAQTLTPHALRGLAEAVQGNATDLAVPMYALPARSGLVNSAILYPLSRGAVRRGAAVSAGNRSRNVGSAGGATGGDGTAIYGSQSA